MNSVKTDQDYIERHDQNWEEIKLATKQKFAILISK